ncbi:hypothetical protein MIS46_04530 [Wielerella bovis]|uniref:hypothetical protein n=1 Tax=Wielerella bovis TaxID=2917790 RepID=UPI002019ADA2|nr:hypothetical protein [Wielerella bovis]ULJ63322.1 hypothetical protein MIS46_04530 [Wielerella bovis]
MNKIQKIACLIGMMVLLNANALAYASLSAEIIIYGVLILAFIYFILIPYVGMRLSCWIYGIVRTCVHKNDKIFL